MQPIAVIATIKAKQGKEKALEEVLKQVVLATHQEKGCLTYSLFKSNSEPGTFFTFERWLTPQDMEVHLSSSHVRTALAKKEELIDSLGISPLTAVHLGESKKQIF